MAAPTGTALAPLAPRLTVNTTNYHVRQAEYQVRGRVLALAAELKAVLKAGGPAAEALPFSEVTHCNIGNPQALGQKPLTFHREVLSLVMYPQLLDVRPVPVGADGEPVFHADAIERARAYLAALPSGAVGAYSESQGIAAVRDEVAAFIEARDGYPARASDIYLTDGASKAAEFVLKMLVRGPTDGIMVPIPQYPLYSATLTLLNATFVPYYLDESRGWGVSGEALEASLAEARAAGVTVRAMVVINPGNPTGQCLDQASMRAITRFCASNGLVLVADEVYQTNIYTDARAFVSFKRVLRDMQREAEAEVAADGGAAAGGGGDDLASLQLVSLHSVSKGFLGECGLRGGYMELVGLDDDVQAMLLKLMSVGLCSNVPGQLSVGLMTHPPAEGQPSYAQYAAQREAVHASLRRRAALVTQALNRLEGVTCNTVEGAMYAFPRVTLPPAAVAAAAAEGVAPDMFYCLAMLNATGIVSVPGSGFGQAEGSFHFRVAFLPPEDRMQAVFGALTGFHDEFLRRYGRV